MTTFQDEYVNLLITQYFESPKAQAEIRLRADQWCSIAEVYRDFLNVMDVDQSYGDALDKIGKIVGVSRFVPLVIPKVAFGFFGNDNARGFADDSNASAISAPFQDGLEPAYSDQTLSDNEFRSLIKVKIALNNASALMVSDDSISIQEVVQEAFGGEAYVIDRQDMTLRLYISLNIDQDVLRLVNALELLPKPLSVQYRDAVQIDFSGSFGFSDNALAKGFADKSDSSAEGGIFANKVN